MEGEGLEKSLTSNVNATDFLITGLTENTRGREVERKGRERRQMREEYPILKVLLFRHLTSSIFLI